MVLAVGDQRADMEGIRRGKDYLLDVGIAAAATFSDELTEPKNAGVDLAWIHRSGLGCDGGLARKMPPDLGEWCCQGNR